MVDLSGALQQMVTLLIIACIGYVAAKLKFVDKSAVEKLTKLLLNVTLPCMIIASAGGLDRQAVQGVVAGAFVLSALQFFLLLGTGALCNFVLRTPRKERPLYLFMSVCTNTGFIGLPVAAAIYGDDSVVICSIFIMVISVFVYSVGFGILAYSEDGRAKIPWKSIVNPSVVACVIALVVFFTGFRMPEIAQNALGMLGGVTSPVAMLIVGVIMAGAKLKDIVAEWRMYPYILIRQLVVPAALFFVLRLLVPDPTLLGVFVVMFAMPVGSMASSFAAQFGRDAALAAKGTVLSTAASFAMVPLLVTIMTLF